MPYDNLPESMWPKMDKCVQDVMDTGKDKEAAIAICYTSMTKSMQEAAEIVSSPGFAEYLKIGAAISRQNHATIQAAHDALAKVDPSVCPNMQQPEQDTEDAAMPADEMMCYQGGPIKAIATEGDGLKVGGYLVRFSTSNDPDLTGDFFTKETDFDIDLPGKSTAYFNHGMDNHFKKRKLEPITLTRDDVGIWAEGILRERDEYEKMLVEMAKAGKLGLSSGVPGHLVERKPEGKANRITSWPLGKDASYTHTPAESRNMVIPLKSLLVAQPEAAGRAVEPASNVDPIVINPSTKDNAMELTKEELQTMLDAASEKGGIKAVEAYRKAEPAVKTPAVTITKDEVEQPNAFKSAGEYFQAVRHAAYYPGDVDRRLMPWKVNGEGKATGMSEGVPADGGFLVIPEYSTGIIERMYKTGEILSRISKDAVTGNTMVYNGIDETSRASTYYGGILGYWMAEGGTKTASKPKWYQLELKLKKVAALCYATDEQLEDTANLNSWLTRTVPNVLRTMAEDAIYNGNGVGKPLGILNSNCLVTVTRDTASKILMADIVTMWSRRWAGVDDYVWLIHQDAAAQLPLLAGTYQNVFMPPGGLSAAPYATLYGKPIIEVEYAQSLNTKGDIMLASLSQYQGITKGDVKSDSSIHVAFTTDETAFRFVYRIDGAPLWNSALTPFHGSNTQSPFVVLGSASA